jgi:hypothetical protein
MVWYFLVGCGREYVLRRNDAAPPSMDLNPELISAGQDSNSDPLETTAEGAEGDDKKKMWIDQEPTFRYWVRKGRRTVDEFGVEVAHG